MKKNWYILILLSCLMLGSCKRDFLNVQNTVSADITVDKLYKNYGYVQTVLYNTYSYLPDGFAQLNREGASDHAEATYAIDGSELFNQGIWNQYNNPDDVYSNYFAGIRQANLYLKNRNLIDISYIKNKITSSDSTTYFNARNNVKFMQGEVLFLKAFYYFELVKRYGGVPLFDKPLDYADQASWRKAKRNSVDEVIKYIASKCDSAAAIIPGDLSPYSWYDDGRVTRGAILALKARALLYGASPLFTGAGSTTSWADAARAAHDVIALNKYSLDNNYSNLFGSNNTSSNELIFYRRYGAQNNVEYANFPIVFQNSNGTSITPTENFVSSFEQVSSAGGATVSMPFDWTDPSMAANPYASRDARLGATVVVNGSTFNNTTIETFTGGNSGLPKQNATKTGYYLSKWVSQSVDLVNNTKTNHAWIYFRYADILLSYAEAMFNAYGATNDNGYGMSALQAINLVRERSHMPDLTDVNQAAIEHERTVELGFENNRVWDVRRWKEGTKYFNVPVNRIEITNGASGLTFNVKVLESRTFYDKMNWYPIPQSEIIKTGWAQNAGW